MRIELLCCNMENPIGVTEPVFSWKIRDFEEPEQTAYRIVVTSLFGDCLWDSGKVISADSAHIEYNGKKLAENTKYFWEVEVFTSNGRYKSDKSYFITGLFEFSGINWITADSKINSPILYKKFELAEIGEYSTVNVCGLGFFELYINGKKVSEDLMNPVRTDYDRVEYRNLKYPYDNETVKRLYYLTYEVSSYLKEGTNTIAVWLGNGWYRQNSRLTEGTFDYGDELKMFLRFCSAGATFDADLSWKYISSPIVYDNIFYGEIYDGRIASTLSGGKAVLATTSPEGFLIPQLCPSECIVETIIPDRLDGSIYDAKACISGFAEFTFSGKAGDKVEIYYAEEINEDGTLNFVSTVGYEKCDRNQIQKDVYILNGNGEEKYAPRFVWHAYRYFKVESPADVKIKEVKAHYVCTSLKKRTKFECSNELLNSFYKMTLNTSLTNFHGCVPVDCAGRENLGYTCDGNLNSLTAMYNFDAKTTYEKWYDDILGAQNKKTGFVPHTAPFNGGGGGPAWGSAIAVIAWNMYLQYGNTQVLKKAKTAVLEWIRYLSHRKENGLIVREEEGSWCLGDWCMPSKYPWSEPHLDDIKTPNELVNTVYYIYCINIYLAITEILGQCPENWVIDEKNNSVLAVNSTFLDMEYAQGEQGSNVFPLIVDIVPKDREEDILGSLIKRIEKNGYTFDTGILGTKFVLQVLDKYGRNDIAAKMMLNTKYPSYGNMIANGATAVWETWEGNGAKSHEGLCSAGAWLFYGLAGLKPMGGYKEFVLKPHFTEELDYLDFELESEYGTIALNWKRTDNGIAIEVKVPFNTTAHVDLDGRCFELKAGTYKEVI